MKEQFPIQAIIKKTENEDPKKIKKNETKDYYGIYNLLRTTDNKLSKKNEKKLEKDFGGNECVDLAYRQQKQILHLLKLKTDGEVKSYLSDIQKEMEQTRIVNSHPWIEIEKKKEIGNYIVGLKAAFEEAKKLCQEGYEVGMHPALDANYSIDFVALKEEKEKKSDEKTTRIELLEVKNGERENDTKHQTINKHLQYLNGAKVYLNEKEQAQVKIEKLESSDFFNYFQKQAEEMRDTFDLLLEFSKKEGKSIEETIEDLGGVKELPISYVIEYMRKLNDDKGNSVILRIVGEMLEDNLSQGEKEKKKEEYQDLLSAIFKMTKKSLPKEEILEEEYLMVGVVAKNRKYFSCFVSSGKKEETELVYSEIEKKWHQKV